jgi:hypothetical protein
MSILTSSPTAAVNDEQVRAVARAVLNSFRLSTQKAALNHADAKRFPIRKGTADIENVIAPIFKALPPAAQQAVKTRALAAVSAPAAAAPAGARAVASALNEFDGVDFQSPVPVSEQLLASASAKPVAGVASALRGPGGGGLDGPRLGEDRRDWPPLGGDGRGEVWPPKVEDRGGKENGNGTLPLKRVVLSLHSLKAVKDTKDWGKDEIYLGATAIGITTANGAPVTSKEIVVEPFSLGSFKKGQTRQLGDRVLYAFNAPKPEQYPAGYAVTLMLVEKDFGKRETLRKSLKAIEDAVAKEIAKWIKTLPGLLGQLAQLVAKLLPPLLAEIFNFIAKLAGDDMFDYRTITISMTSPDDRLPGSDFTPLETVPILMKGGKNGQYDLAYKWHAFA